MIYCFEFIQQNLLGYRCPVVLILEDFYVIISDEKNTATKAGKKV